MLCAKHAFLKTTDGNYSSLMKDPKAALDKRELIFSEEVLDLIIGML